MFQQVVRLFRRMGKALAGVVGGDQSTTQHSAIAGDPENFRGGTRGHADALVLEHAVNQCTLRMLTHPLFMHYGEAEGSSDLPGSEPWKNTHLFFWEAEEPFERKALPESFMALPQHFFLILEMPDDLELSGGVVAPWFGQPGGGIKYSFVHGKQPVELNELKQLGILREVEMVTITQENLAVLTDRSHHLLLVKKKDLHPTTLRLQDTNGKVLTLYEALVAGKVRVVRMK